MTKSSITITPDLTGFVEQFKESSVVPLSAKFILDSLTPLSLMSLFPDDCFVCLLESLGNTPEDSRYSILGFDPKATFSFNGKETIEQWKGETAKKGDAKGVVRQLDDFLRSFHSVFDDSIPLSNGGLIGYVSRDLLLPDSDNTSQKVDGLPLVHFVVPQTFIIFDAVQREITLLVNAFAHGHASAESAYNEAKQIIEERIANICGSPTKKLKFFDADLLPERTTDEPDVTLTDQAHSLTNAAESQKISEVYLSRSITCETTADPVSVYRVFRVVYPSAYCYLFRINGFYYIGSHEPADAPHSLSFANLLRHVLKDKRFVGDPSHKACELRRTAGLRYRHDSAVFGYVGFNGRYKLTHGNKEVIIKTVKSGNEALFSHAARANWEGVYSDRRPTNLVVKNAGSASATIRQILVAAETLK
jgi:hypothetical protein